MIKPTMPAPDFSADAYHLGERVSISLNHYLNDWVALFFYASDFTFV